jgi:hypothetical protein
MVSWGFVNLDSGTYVSPGVDVGEEISACANHFRLGSYAEAQRQPSRSIYIKLFQHFLVTAWLMYDLKMQAK